MAPLVYYQPWRTCIDICTTLEMQPTALERYRREELGDGGLGEKMLYNVIL